MHRAAYLVPIFLLASLDLDARPPQGLVVKAAPAPGAPARVKGLTLTGELMGEPGKPVVVAIRGQNPLDEPVTTLVRVRVMEQPASSMMARMVPMPRERASQVVEVAMGPHEKLDHRVTFESLVRPNTKKIRKAKNARLRMMSPARMYVEVRVVKDKPLARR